MITPSNTPLRLVVALAFVLLPVAGCASSQDTSADNDRVTRQVEAIDAAVDLTDVQAARIGEILTAAQADRPTGPPPRGAQADRPTGPPPRGAQAGGSDQRAEMEASRAETDRLIEASLTKEQVERYRVWRASQPERPQGPPPRGQ